MILVKISKSTIPSKKLMAVFFKQGKKIKTTHFGSSPNKDFTIYSKDSRSKAEQEKKKYLARHRVRENWNDYKSSGSLSRYILWNKPTVKSSIYDYVRRFNLKLIK